MAKQIRRMALLILLSVSVILAGGLHYISNVRSSLWNKSVTDILEVTTQGRHALDTYMEKDMEALHWLAAGLASISAADGPALLDRIGVYSGDAYFCADLDRGIIYTPLLEDGRLLEEAQREALSALEGSGMREPFLDGRTGVWTIGCYERFRFADGTRGLVQKTIPLAALAERFSLSFYNDSGFSYVVNREGKILVRSQHRNSNRTFQNLFDVIDLQGNDPAQVDAFRAALEDGKRGVARFYYQGEEYVFCYVPMESAPDWYVVSIVPNRVIMQQTNNIVQHSQVLILLILACGLILGAFLLIYRNTTRRVLTAEEQARKAAESANLAKSRFLSNMSHDIRTPMNAIIGMTKLASDHLDDPDKVKRYLKNISLSGQLLVGLINDILDMSKIESGKMSLNNDKASLNDLLTNLVKMVQPVMDKKNQQFNIRLHHIAHENLCFDALRLNQVMINLLSNASKFTPEGGAVSVDVTERPSSRANCAHYTFRVADTGMGIKPEFLPHIFNSFTRERDDRVYHTEGSGLGMAITKMIVDMMEGSIAVESAPGKGSVFTVELDLLLAEEGAQAEAPLPPLRVLFVDDDPETRDSAAVFLRELGMRAEIVGSGREAVRLAAEAHACGEEYGLIFLDWKMPDLDGVQAVREIQAQGGAHAPVVLLSACDWSNVEQEAREAGVDGFIQKPFFKSTLSHCIRRYALREEGAALPQHDNVDLSGRRILLAEDNELNQEIARELLAGLGAEVEVSGDGLQCLQRFTQSPPGYFDLILMDIQMPVMNGYEATARIRSLPRPDAASIPIFAMTADAFAEDIAAAKKAGMNRHIAKPLDIPALLRQLQGYLKR